MRIPTLGKQAIFLLGISLTIVTISFSISSVYAAETTSTFSLLELPFDVAVDTNDRIIVAQIFDNSTAVFDASGNLEFTIRNDTFSNFGIQRVTTDSNNRIILADVINNKIFIFDSFGNFEKIFSVTKAGDIATDSKNRIIVVDSTAPSIQVFDSDGNHELTITDSILVSPLSVTTDSNDRIIVGDQGILNASIHIFDKDGNLDFSIVPVQSIFSNNGENIFYRYAFIDRPISIATDSQDRIIVADNDQYGQVIHVFDKDGNYESIIRKDQTVYRWTHVVKNFPEVSSLIQFFDWGIIKGIDIDSNDRVIVSTSGNSVNIVTIFQAATTTSDSCSSDCTPPSLESLELNNISNWLTAKNQTFNIEDKQVMTFVYYENEGIDDIKDVEIGFGLPTKKSPMYTSEIRLQINTFNGNLTSLEIDDENKLFLNSTTVKVDQVQCGLLNCLEYTLEFVWAEIPFDDYFLITASDDHRNTSYNSSQEPLTVIGETLNEQPIYDIYNRHTSTKHDGYSFNITRTDKVTDMWIDEKGEEWYGLGNDRFELVN